MTDIARFRLRDAGKPARLFITAFLLTVTAGYAVGLFFVEHSTGFSPGGVQTQFLGTTEDSPSAEMRYEKSAREMFVFIHNHVLSLGLVFFAIGGLVLLCGGLPPRLRAVVAVEPFVAIATTFGGIVLVRYISPVFSWLVMLSGVSLFVAYSLAVVLILRELWGSRGPEPGSPR